MLTYFINDEANQMHRLDWIVEDKMKIEYKMDRNKLIFGRRTSLDLIESK